MTSIKQRFLQSLPDLPRWLATRHLLLSEDSQVIEVPAKNGFVVWSINSEVGSVVGVPNSGALAEVSRDVSELLAFDTNVEAVGSILGDFVASPAFILTAPLRLPESPEGICRRLESYDRDLLKRLPTSLLDEITEVLCQNQLLIAAFDGQLPVAFAYAAFETESLWDVSIDTLPSHRRRGFAKAAVIELMRIMQRKGKSAVWGASEDNPASINLAFRLGFAIADRIWVLSRPTITSASNPA